MYNSAARTQVSPRNGTAIKNLAAVHGVVVVLPAKIQNS